MDLSVGYRLIQNRQANLENEFSRAVEIGYKRKYNQELNDWQKKRRSFITLAALVPLPFIALCISIFYFRDVACVLSWWLLTSLLALLAMVVSGGGYILQMITGRPVPQRAKVAANLADQWWENLSPRILITRSKDDRREADFITSLVPHFSDEWLAVHNFFISNQEQTYTNILLLGPSGLWLFEVVDWKGSIGKKDGQWFQIHKKNPVVLDEHPDEAWNIQKEELLNSIRIRLPHLSWISPLMQGGIVFTNPKITLDKTLIEGNTAPYGLADAWRQRLIQSQPEEKLTMEVRLEIKDMLFTTMRPPEVPSGEYRSSRDEANRIYMEVANQLREHVSKLVN